ncbi:MAG TPA: hypothetical protein VIE89_05395 [Candidatus Binatia bacterium]
MTTAPNGFYGIMKTWLGQVYIVSGGLPLNVIDAVGVSRLPSGKNIAKA